jgi:hypothetical protein
LTKNSSNLSETKIIKSDNHCALCGAPLNRLIEDEPKPGFYYCTRCYRHYPKKLKFRAILLDENPTYCLKCGNDNFIEDTKYKSEINGIAYVVTTIFCLNCKEVIVYCIFYDRIFSHIALNTQMIKKIDPNSIFPNNKKITKHNRTTIEKSKTENHEINDQTNQSNSIKTKIPIPHRNPFFGNQLKDVNELIDLFSEEEDHSYYILSQLVTDIFHIRNKTKSLQLELQNYVSEFMKKTNKLETRAEDGEIYTDKILEVVNDRSMNMKMIFIDLINYINWSISTTFETWRRNEEASEGVNTKKRDNELMRLSEMCYRLLESLKIISCHPSLWTVFHGSVQLTSEYESFKVLLDNVFSFKMKNEQVKESNRFYMTILDKFDKLEFIMKKIRGLLETYEYKVLSYEKNNESKTQTITSLQSLIEQLHEKNDKLILLVKDT